MPNKAAKRNKAKQKKAKLAKAVDNPISNASAAVSDTAAELTATFTSLALGSSSTPAKLPTASVSGMVEIRDIPGKGKGVVALVDVPAGTRIIKEAPVMTMTAGDPAEVEEKIAKALSTLSSEQRAAFSELHNADPSHPQHNWTTFNTNALPLGAGSPKGAVYATLCRINHSCLPNTHHAWNENLKLETIHALRDISKGEEVTIAYTLDGTRAERRALLHNQFGFECQCEVCSASDEDIAASDARRRQIAQLDAGIGDPMRVGMMPGAVMAECAILARLLEEEYKGDSALAARTYYDAFQVAACHSDIAAAKKFARDAYECRVKVEGEDSPLTRRMKKFSQNPRSHPAYGMY